MCKCPYYSKCIQSFFKNELGDDKIMKAIIKHDFCIQKPSQCARYWIYNKLGDHKLPDDFYPYQKRDARNMIPELRLIRGGKERFNNDTLQ